MNGTPPTKQRRNSLGWLIGIAFIAALIGGIWLLIFGFTDAPTAGFFTVCFVVWALFHIDRPSRSRNWECGRYPRGTYGARWLVLWGLCFCGCMTGSVLVLLEDDVQWIGILLFCGLGVISLWLFFRLLWPRLWLRLPRLVLKIERSRGVVSGTFHQRCRREVERASVNIRLGQEVSERGDLPDPDGDPGSKRTVVVTRFHAIVEATRRATLQSVEDEGLPEIVASFSIHLDPIPQHLVVETRTLFGGWQDYKARF